MDQDKRPSDRHLQPNHQSLVDKNQKELKELIHICKEQEKILTETEKYLENISFQSSMLLTLIQDLLDLAKLETMNFKFNNDYFDFNDMIA